MLEALENRWLPSQIGLTVTSLADSGPGTFRDAIQTADAGSHSDKFTIGFAAGLTGTIDLQSALPDLNNSIAIQGPGASSLTVEPAAGVSLTSAIFTVDGGQTASLSGLTIANGNAGGIVNSGTLTVANCAVVDDGSPLVNHLALEGGGVYNVGTVTVQGSTFSGDSAAAGGAIFNNGGTCTAQQSIFSGNTADVGGGIYNNAFTLTQTISGCTFSGNSASFDGGGIFNRGGALTVSASTLSGNTAESGGAIFNAGTATVQQSTLSANTAGSDGGAIFCQGTLTVSRSTLTANLATYGGAIYSLVSNVTVANSTISANSATYGGGIYNDDESGPASVTVRDSVLTGNSATEGGGIYNNASSALEVQNSTFSANTAGDSGGGLYNLGTATVQQSTLSGNTAASDGGGLFSAASGTLAIDDSTVCNNSAALGADLYNLGVATINDSDVCVIGP